VVKPPHRREMAQRANNDLSVSIRISCDVFGISEAYYAIKRSCRLIVTRANVLTAKVAVNKKKSSTDVAKTTLFETVVKTIHIGLNWQAVLVIPA